MADYLLGVWSVLHDTDMRRRELYGAAGAYRPKKYGVEYRTMSNFWLRSPQLMREVHKRAQACYQFRNELPDAMIVFSHTLVQQAINESDVELCIRINDYVEREFLNDSI